MMKMAKAMKDLKKKWRSKAKCPGSPLGRTGPHRNKATHLPTNSTHHSLLQCEILIKLYLSDLSLVKQNFVKQDQVKMSQHSPSPPTGHG